MTEGVAEETANQRATDHARRIDGLVAISIVGIFLDSVGPRITRTPAVLRLNYNGRWRRSVIHRDHTEHRIRDEPGGDFNEISIAVNDHPPMAGTRRREMIHARLRDEISWTDIQFRKSFTPAPHLPRLPRRHPVMPVSEPRRIIAVAVKSVVTPARGDSDGSAKYQ
jgi:hypothetical protein